MVSRKISSFEREDRAHIFTMALKEAAISEVRCSSTTTTVWMLPLGTYGWVSQECTLSMIRQIRQCCPPVAFDLPLAIADRQFDANNQIPYVFDPNGVTGDKILVNGVYQPYLEVGDRKYRLRMLVCV